MNGKEIVCRYCNRKGHLRAYCYKSRPEKSNIEGHDHNYDSGCDIDQTDKNMIEMHEKDSPKEDLELSA